VFLPGGGIRTDETPEQAVLREVREECGLLETESPAEPVPSDCERILELRRSAAHHAGE
jgi:8-oxo-dGTP pyrophosphatase MutT (NUDIX family)